MLDVAARVALSVAHAVIGTRLRSGLLASKLILLARARARSLTRFRGLGPNLVLLLCNHLLLACGVGRRYGTRLVQRAATIVRSCRLRSQICRVHAARVLGVLGGAAHLPASFLLTSGIHCSFRSRSID